MNRCRLRKRLRGQPEKKEEKEFYKNDSEFSDYSVVIYISDFSEYSVVPLNSDFSEYSVVLFECGFGKLVFVF